MNEQEIVKKLEEQNKRQAQLEQMRSKIEATIEHYQNEYQKVCQQAKEEFGTDNLADLRKELNRRRDANQKALENFTISLDKQEKHLKEVQQILDRVMKES